MKNDEQSEMQQIEEALLRGEISKEELSEKLISSIEKFPTMTQELVEGGEDPPVNKLTKEEEEKMKEDIERANKIAMLLIEAMRQFRVDKVNTFTIHNPQVSEVLSVRNIWVKFRSQKGPRLILSLELIDCAIPQEVIEETFKIYPSIKVNYNGTAIENKEGILKVEGDLNFEGTSEFGTIISESNNIIYTGQVLNMRYHGVGKLNVSDKKNSFTYEGQFQNAKMHGKGRLSTRCEVYVGEFKNDFKDGLGKQFKFKKPKKKDQNKEITVKSQYQGEFKVGMRDGQGIEKTPHGEYNGSWKDDQKHGQGKITYYNNDEYQGNWAYNEFDGFGTYIEYDNCTYSGDFKSGKYHGHGKMTYKNGDVYEGDFQNGMKHGKGKYDYSDGDYYDGDWRNDSADGEGTTMMADEFFIGEFKNGVKNGEGELTTGQGDVIRAFWENGKQRKIIEMNGEPYDQAQS